MTDTLRRYTPSDASALALLIHNAIHEGASSAYSSEQLHAWSPKPKSLADIKHRLHDQICVIAEDETGIAGVMTIKGAGLLDLAFVRADRKGDGLASRLYEALLSHARPLKFTKLSVQASHLARPFFEKKGWRLIKTQTVSVNGVQMENHEMALHLF